MSIIHARIVLTGKLIHMWIHRQNRVPSKPLLDKLVNRRWLSFLTIDMCCHLTNGITSFGE